jgi:hypothetical protein
VEGGLFERGGGGQSKIQARYRDQVGIDRAERVLIRFDGCIRVMR